MCYTSLGLCAKYRSEGGIYGVQLLSRDAGILDWSTGSRPSCSASDRPPANAPGKAASDGQVTTLELLAPECLGLCTRMVGDHTGAAGPCVCPARPGSCSHWGSEDGRPLPASQGIMPAFPTLRSSFLPVHPLGSLQLTATHTRGPGGVPCWACPVSVDI